MSLSRINTYCSVGLACVTQCNTVPPMLYCDMPGNDSALRLLAMGSFQACSPCSPDSVGLGEAGYKQHWALRTGP